VLYLFQGIKLELEISSKFNRIWSVHLTWLSHLIFPLLFNYFRLLCAFIRPLSVFHETAQQRH